MCQLFGKQFVNDFESIMHLHDDGHAVVVEYLLPVELAARDARPFFSKSRSAAACAATDPCQIP
jgi:hypothetical protein